MNSNILDFELIRETRDKLVESLIMLGKNSEEGLFPSHPHNIGNSISFTNSGMVLQCLNEAGYKTEAFTLKRKLYKYLKESESPSFQGEGLSSSHIMCTSWAVFSMLETDPSLVFKNALKECLKWYIETQKEDGSWNLFAGYESKSKPLWTAYALNTLFQYLDAYNDFNVKDELVDQLDNSIRKGVEFLLSIRKKKELENSGLYLWSHLDGDRNIPSLTMTAMCTHLLLKASERYEYGNLENELIRTVETLMAGFDSENKTIQINEEKISFWGDKVHDTGADYNYYWALFTPITLVTLLNIFKRKGIKENEKFLEYLTYFINWICENNDDEEGFFGVYQEDSHRILSIWSTAQSVIVLSRFLNKFHLVLSHSNFKGNDVQPIQSEIKNLLIEDQKSLILRNEKERIELLSEKISTIYIPVITFVTFILLYAFIVMRFGDLIVENWNILEPWTLLIEIGFFIAGGILPTGTFLKRDRIKKWLTKVLFERVEKNIHRLFQS